MGSMGGIVHINILHVAHNLLQIFNSNKSMRKGHIGLFYLALLFS